MEDLLEDAEGEAMSMLLEAKFDPVEGGSVNLLCQRLIKSAPHYVRMVGTADLWPFNGRQILRVHRMLPPAVQREKICHELAEWRANTTSRAFASLGLREMWCNAVAARLLCPTPAFKLGVREFGHSVRRLADAFGSTQAMSLLRIGEVTGRPVLLLRPVPVARGQVFVWPSRMKDARAHGTHPVRVDDGFGLMAEVAVWRGLAA